MSSPSIEERGVVETLDAVESQFEARRWADAEMLLLAAHFADLHAEEPVRLVGGPTLPGAERGVRLGGEGTPTVAEFACMELGARMQQGAWAARHYLADALDLRHRLPRVWARVQAHEARVAFVRLVAAKTRHLPPEAAAYVDRAMADHVDGSLPWGRFETRLAGTIVAADPETAAAREAARVAEQFAKRTRSSEDGTAGFYVRSTIGVIARVEASVAFVADALAALGDGDPEDVRRVKALVVLCNPTAAVELLAAFAAHRSRTTDVVLPLADQDPEEEHPAEAVPPDALDRVNAFARTVGFTPTHLPPWLGVRCRPGTTETPTFTFDWSKLLPPVTLNVHLTAETLARDRSGVVRWEGEGPVTTQFVHEHLRPLHSYVIQPVIDLAHVAPVDSYEIPDRHRRAVRLRTPADCAPYSSDLSAEVDNDHTEPYQPADGLGRQLSSRLENYSPLGRFNHRVKTHGRWTVRQPFSGIFVWRDPHGQIYLVDHTGNRKVTKTGTRAGRAREFDPDLELFPTATVVELDAGSASA